MTSLDRIKIKKYEKRIKLIDKMIELALLLGHNDVIEESIDSLRDYQARLFIKRSRLIRVSPLFFDPLEKINRTNITIDNLTNEQCLLYFRF
jgi:hypothetical protein